MKKTNKSILREIPKRKIEVVPIDYEFKGNFNLIRINNMSRLLRPIVITRAIENFLNSEEGLKEIMKEDDQVIKDIKIRKKYIQNELSKHLIANEYKEGTKMIDYLPEVKKKLAR